jgi:hypothetical protein
MQSYVFIYQTKRRQLPEDSILHTHRLDQLKSHVTYVYSEVTLP